MQDFITNLTIQAVNTNSKPLLDVLNKCIMDVKDDVVVLYSGLEKVLDILITEINPIAPQQEDHIDIDKSSAFLSQVYSTICTSSGAINPKLMENTFLKLFFLSCQDNICNVLLGETVDIIDQAWQKGITSGRVIVDDSCLTKCAQIIEDCIKISHYLQPPEPESGLMLNIQDISIFIVKFINFAHPYVTECENDKNKQLDKIIGKILIIEDPVVAKLYSTATFIESIKYHYIPVNGFTNSCDFKKMSLLWKMVLINICAYDNYLLGKIENQDPSLYDAETIINHINKFCTKQILNELVKYIKISAATDVLLNNNIEVSTINNYQYFLFMQ